MSSRSIALVLASFGTAVTAQSVSLTTASAITASSASGAIVQNASLPAGPLTGSRLFTGRNRVRPGCS